MTSSASNLDDLKQVSVPVLRPSKFAELSGIGLATVITLMDQQKLPVITFGSGVRPTRYINLVALHKHCEKEAASWVN